MKPKCETICVGANQQSPRRIREVNKQHRQKMKTKIENKTYKGITASVEAWSRLGIRISEDGTPDYDSDGRFGAVTGVQYNSLSRLFPPLIARAIDSLPDGASGEKILARVATLAARDKNIAALGKFGEKIPSNINVWHHVPELRALLPDSGANAAEISV